MRMRNIHQASFSVLEVDPSQSGCQISAISGLYQTARRLSPVNPSAAQVVMAKKRRILREGGPEPVEDGEIGAAKLEVEAPLPWWRRVLGWVM